MSKTFWHDEENPPIESAFHDDVVRLMERVNTLILVGKGVIFIGLPLMVSLHVYEHTERERLGELIASLRSDLQQVASLQQARIVRQERDHLNCHRWDD